MIKITSGNPQITEKDMAAFEARIGVRLPEDYREFMLAYNGGEPDRTAFNAKKYGGSIMQRFFCLGPAYYESDGFDGVLNAYEGRIPPDFLPIARDMSGNLILIGTKQKRVGKIYFWWHENEGENKAWLKNIFNIDRSFTAFLNNLEEEMEEEESYGELVDLFNSNDYEKQLQKINSGWDVNTPLEKGFGFAIERVAMDGHIEVLKALIANGARFGKALKQALTFGNAEAAGLLLEAGADPDYATEEDRIERNTLLGDAVNMPVGSKGPTNREIARLLIEYGADVRVENDYGWTALKLAERSVRQNYTDLQEIVDLIKSKLNNHPIE